MKRRELLLGLLALPLAGLVAAKDAVARRTGWWSVTGTCIGSSGNGLCLVQGGGPPPEPTIMDFRDGDVIIGETMTIEIRNGEVWVVDPNETTSAA